MKMLLIIIAVSHLQVCVLIASRVAKALVVPFVWVVVSLLD
jgi:hypothetical protein